MSEENVRSDFFNELQREIGDGLRTFANGWRNAGVSFRNGMRRLRGASVDYVVMPLGGSLPEREAPPRSFIERQLPLPEPPFTMQQLNRRLDAVGNATNVQGVLLIFRGFSAGLGTLQNVRRAIERLQAAGKTVIVFTPYLDLAHYFVASAADRIIAPPSAQFDVLGIRSEMIFFKDALQQLGMQADVIQISPYKTAFNQFSESNITPEQQEQMAWLLDDTFEMVTAGMANGRALSLETMQSHIDSAPLTAQQALDANLIDHLAYEDELAALLGKSTETEAKTEAETEEEVESETEPEEMAAETEEASAEEEGSKKKTPELALVTWEKARPLLMEKPVHRQKQFIGVISLVGNIMMGPSRESPVDLPIPFVGGAVAGEQTLRRLIRKAEEMDQLAALIFHVDSGGGSALASDLIGREIERLNKKKPVLVYMGNVAASGGYYVSAHARHIMSQSGTITGSIGVITARVSTQGLYDKLSINRFSIQRGDHAGLYSDAAPMTADERQLFQHSIEETYLRFKETVANGRELPFDALDPICEGRVWTGRQALDHQLVDSHGDFVDAIRKAAALAELPGVEDDLVPAVNLYSKRDDYVLPESIAPAEQLVHLLSGERLKKLLNQPLMMMPYVWRWR